VGARGVASLHTHLASRCDATTHAATGFDEGGASVRVAGLVSLTDQAFTAMLRVSQRHATSTVATSASVIAGEDDRASLATTKPATTATTIIVAAHQRATERMRSRV
jgi:hypothetical protein